MRIALTAVLLFVAAGAGAQESAAPERRAPLANVDDLEPAVDVGGSRPAAATPPPAALTSPAPTQGAAAAPSLAPWAGVQVAVPVHGPAEIAGIPIADSVVEQLLG